MKIVIIGGGLFNKGGAAMMRTVISELGQRLPQAQFYVGTHHVRQIGAGDLLASGVPQIQVSVRPRWERLKQLVKSALVLPERPRYWYKRKSDIFYQQAIVEAADAFVDISGFLYVDKRDPSEAMKLVTLTLMAEAQGVPYIYLSQTFGPFTISTLRRGVAKAVRASSLLYTRDRQSRAHLAALLGKKEQEVRLSPDIAFLFKGDAPSAEAMRQLGLNSEKPILGVSPNMRVYERSAGDVAGNKYIRALSGMIRHFTEQGVQVLLLPHEMRTQKGKADDRTLCNMLLQEVPSDLVRNLEGLPTAEQIKGIIGGCDLVVGSRFHSLVAALSQGVPAVAVGWAHKYPELLREFGLGEYVYDYDTVSDEDFTRVVYEAWCSREELKKRVDAALPRVKEQVASVFDEVAETIEGAAGKRPQRASQAA